MKNFEVRVTFNNFDKGGCVSNVYTVEATNENVAKEIARTKIWNENNKADGNISIDFCYEIRG